MTGPLHVVVPLVTVSEANQREHWSVRARRVKSQRQVVGWALAPHSEHLPAIRAGAVIVVDLVRVSPRKLDDDNLRGALKAVRDACAEWIGIDDGSARYEWRYAQRRGPAAVALTFAARVVAQG